MVTVRHQNVNRLHDGLESSSQAEQSHEIRKGGVAFLALEVAFPIAIKRDWRAEGSGPTILTPDQAGLNGDRETRAAPASAAADDVRGGGAFHASAQGKRQPIFRQKLITK